MLCVPCSTALPSGVGTGSKTWRGVRGSPEIQPAVAARAGRSGGLAGDCRLQSKPVWTTSLESTGLWNWVGLLEHLSNINKSYTET